MINTRFWNDNYVSNLDPIEKLMFLYLLTNPATSICGVYELPLKNIALDTGIDKEMVQKILDRFAADEKAAYINGWVCVRNFIKHQNQMSPKVKTGIDNEIALIPKTIREKLEEIGYGMHTLSHSNSNSNSNPNTATTSVAEIISAFSLVNKSYEKWYKNKTQREAAARLVNTYGRAKVLQITSYLPQSNKMPYFPTITTPAQLEDKWAAWEAAKDRKGAELSSRRANVAFV